MNTAAVLRGARGDMTQAELAERLHTVPQTVSYWERGSRPVTRHMRETLARELDRPALYLAMAHEATGGVMVPAWPEEVDHHRLAAIELNEVEIGEYEQAFQAARRAILAHPGGDDLDEVSRRRIRGVIQEVLDVMDSASLVAGALMQTYGVSPKAVYAERRGRRRR